MKTGPKPKPSQLKKLEGNPGKRTLPSNEPDPEPAIPPCPAFIKGAGRREWKRITPQLYKLGLLSHIDRAMLSGYCVGWMQLEEVEKALAKMRKSASEIAKLKKKNPDMKANVSNGLVSITSNGNAVIEPLLSVRKQALETIHKFGAEFGMSPASRTRIQGEAAGKKETKSAMARLLEAHSQLSN